MLNHLLSLIIVISVYFLSIAVIAGSKDLQTFLVFLPNVRLPMSSLSNLNSYGLDGIARNIETRTSDGNLLKGWHLYNGNDNSEKGRSPTDSDIANSKRIIVYFHGNAFTRGFPSRIRKIKKLSRAFDAHVIVFDYSGFADSTGYPSEEVALNDALAVLQYINSTVVKHNPTASGWYTHQSSSSKPHQPQLYFYGHSLGTGISSALLHHLETSEIKGRHNPISGLIMDSPFTSIPDVVADHILVKYFQPIRDYVKRVFTIRFPTFERIPSLNVPLLIMHGARDGTIPVEHGRRLYNAATSDFLCSAGVDTFGICPVTEKKKKRVVRYWEVPSADHNSVASSEGWSETIGQFIREVEEEEQQ